MCDGRCTCTQWYVLYEKNIVVLNCCFNFSRSVVIWIWPRPDRDYHLIYAKNDSLFLNNKCRASFRSIERCVNTRWQIPVLYSLSKKLYDRLCKKITGNPNHENENWFPKLTKQFTRNSRYERCPVGHVFVWSRYRFIRYNGRDTCSLVLALSDEGCFL